MLKQQRVHVQKGMHVLMQLATLRSPIPTLRQRQMSLKAVRVAVRLPVKRTMLWIRLPTWPQMSGNALRMASPLAMHPPRTLALMHLRKQTT